MLVDLFQNIEPEWVEEEEDEVYTDSSAFLKVRVDRDFIYNILEFEFLMFYGIKYVVNLMRVNKVIGLMIVLLRIYLIFPPFLNKNLTGP